MMMIPEAIKCPECSTRAEFYRLVYVTPPGDYVCASCGRKFTLTRRLTDGVNKESFNETKT